MGQNNRRLFFNAKIFTADENRKFADAMIVENGKIRWIGWEREIAGWEGPRVNLKGKRVIPGFIDAHMHPVMLSQNILQVAATPPEVLSIEDLVDKLQKRLTNIEPGAWLLGWGYDEGKLAERRPPDRHDLDRVSTDVPIAVVRTCTHIISVNSRALELAGINRNTPDPPGGEIVRDAAGDPTGILKENARFLVIEKFPKKNLNGQAKDMAALGEILLEKGVTAVAEMMAEKRPIDHYDLFLEARRNGFRQRVVLYYLLDHLEEVPSFDHEKTDRRQPVFVGGVKIFTDGSISGRSAWVDPPFEGGEKGTGLQIATESEFRRAIAIAKRSRIQLAIHAMGERAIDFALSNVEGERSWLDSIPSVRLEHASLMTEEAIGRIQTSGIAVITQPIFPFAEIESYLANLGSERTKRAYPIRSMIEAGILLAISSDAPGTSWSDAANPFISIQAAVTRKACDGTDIGEREAIDVETAIGLYTRNAAWVLGIPDAGKLAPGYSADFLVLDRDILDVRPEEIGQLRVDDTYISGEKVFSRLTSE
jgi:Amidohydrolase family.